MKRIGLFLIAAILALHFGNRAFGSGLDLAKLVRLERTMGHFALFTSWTAEVTVGRALHYDASQTCREILENPTQLEMSILLPWQRVDDLLERLDGRWSVTADLKLKTFVERDLERGLIDGDALREYFGDAEVSMSNLMRVRFALGTLLMHHYQSIFIGDNAVEDAKSLAEYAPNYPAYVDQWVDYVVYTDALYRLAEALLRKDKDPDPRKTKHWTERALALRDNPKTPQAFRTFLADALNMPSHTGIGLVVLAIEPLGNNESL